MRKGNQLRKLIAATCIAASLLVPAATASAATSPPPAGVKDCPPGYVGYVVWAWNEKRGYYDVVSFCIPYGP